jgi:hypothetical protein
MGSLVTRILTGIRIIIIVFFGKKDVILRRDGLLTGKMFVLDFSQLDHCDGAITRKRSDRELEEGSKDYNNDKE